MIVVIAVVVVAASPDQARQPRQELRQNFPLQDAFQGSRGGVRRRGREVLGVGVRRRGRRCWEERGVLGGGRLGDGRMCYQKVCYAGCEWVL